MSSIAGTIKVTNNRVNTNPLFVGVSSNDYHLQPSSPAMNTGLPVPVTHDFDGNLRSIGSGYDIGAYEHP